MGGGVVGVGVGWGWLNAWTNRLTQSQHTPKRHTNTQTEGKPLTSPSTNLAIDPTLAILAPVELIRSQVLTYKEAKAREWEEQVRPWREWKAAVQAEGVGSESGGSSLL